MVTIMVTKEQPCKHSRRRNSKARCLALMDEVARTGEPILITKNGKPVAELRPPLTQRAASPFGLHKGRLEIRGDLLAPIDVAWDAAK